MLQVKRYTKSMRLGWGCIACHGREVMQVEEAISMGVSADPGTMIANVIPRPELTVCAKCGLLYMTEILEEKNA